PDLKSRFAEAAATNYDRASHFAIFPTVLQIMGYPLGFVRETFGEDLLSQINTQQAFTSGEVFGLFADINWNPVDVHARYLEQSFTVWSVERRTNRYGGESRRCEKTRRGCPATPQRWAHQGLSSPMTPPQ